MAAREFDTSKDVILATIGVIDVGDEGGGFPIHVTLNSWDGGEPKLSLVRKGETKDGAERFGKLGRLTEAETIELAKLISDFVTGSFAKAAKGRTSKKAAPKSEDVEEIDTAVPYWIQKEDGETWVCFAGGKSGLSPKQRRALKDIGVEWDPNAGEEGAWYIPGPDLKAAEAALGVTLARLVSKSSGTKTAPKPSPRTTPRGKNFTEDGRVRAKPRGDLKMDYGSKPETEAKPAPAERAKPGRRAAK